MPKFQTNLTLTMKSGRIRIYMAPNGLGHGHITRCQAIADALSRLGYHTIFSTYLDGVEYAVKKGLNVIQTVPFAPRIKPDGSIDFKKTPATLGLSLGLRRVLRQLNAEITNMIRYRPHLVLSDSRATPIIAARLLGIPCIVLLNQYRINIVRRPNQENLTMFDRVFFLIVNILWVFIRTLIQAIWALSDCILIPDLPNPYTISASNLTIARRHQRKVRFVGPIVPIKPADLPSQLNLKKDLGFSPSKPLIYAAISGPRPERTPLVKRLSTILSSFPGDYDIVMSCGSPLRANRHTKLGNLIIFNWIEDQSRYLKACDVVISRAGHGTILKSILYSKPLILIPTPDQTEQIGNAQRVSGMGLATILPQQKLSNESLLRAVASAQSSLNSQQARKVVAEASEMDSIRSTVEIVKNLVLKSKFLDRS